jgi:hypothetical protein
MICITHLHETTWTVFKAKIKAIGIFTYLWVTDKLLDDLERTWYLSMRVDVYNDCDRSQNSRKLTSSEWNSFNFWKASQYLTRFDTFDFTLPFHISLICPEVRVRMSMVGSCFCQWEFSTLFFVSSWRECSELVDLSQFDNCSISWYW